MGEKGYKAFDPGLICRGKQYTENTTFEESGNVAACKEGMMHYCQNPFDCLNHYDLVNSDGKFSDFAEVEALGDIKRDGTKSATNKIHIGAKLGLKGFIKAAVDFTIEKTSFEKLELNTKTLEDLLDSAQIGSSGDYAKIGSSGDYAQIGSSGYSAKIGSSGYYAKIGSSGDSAKIRSTGKNAVVMAAGYKSIAKAKIGSWITLAEWVREDGEWIPKCVKTEHVDGTRIKEDVFYRLVDGNFCEVK